MPRGVYERKKAKLRKTRKSMREFAKEASEAKARRAKASSSCDVGAKSGTQTWAADQALVDLKLDSKDQEIYNLRREVGDLNARLSQRDGRVASERDQLLYAVEQLASGVLNLVKAYRHV